MSISAFILRFIGSLAGALLPKGKQLYAERSAGKAPESAPADHAEEILDEALGRLGAVDLDHPWWKSALVELGAAAVRPDWFKKPHVQEWLGQPFVRRMLKVTAKARLTGAAVHQDDYEELIQSYIANSYEDRNYAESVISLAAAVLKASILGAVRDPGTAAIVQVTGEDQRDLLLALNEKVEAISQSAALNVPMEHFDEAVKENWRAELSRTSQDLLAWPTTLANEEWIPRPEYDQILRIIEDSNFSTTALLGQPGSGKSALMAVLGKHFQEERGWSVLAIKADLLDTGVVTEADLQARLDLPEKPSVMLQRLASHGPVVLLVDQLDALASYLDMHTGRLSALLNLVRRVGRLNKIHVVLSSRTFEFNHDVRLRAIDAQSLALEAPPWSEVEKILQSNGVHAAGWPADAQEVMRFPQALSTYLKLKARGQSEPFTTYQGMLDGLWNERVLHGEAGPRQAQLAYQIANIMAEEECLWLARARFDDQVEDVQALLASGILTAYGPQSSLGFAHQTLFEYALARSFALEAGRLSSYVIARQESLFVRPKLWAALNYLRTAQPSTYDSELHAIWTSTGLRKHLRFLLLDFLGQQVAPTDREALLLEQALRSPDERALAFKALAGSPGWFARFAESFVAEAMAEAGMADLMINVLASAWAFAPELVSRLLIDRWATVEANDRRIWLVLQSALAWLDSTLALAKHVVLRTEISPFHIDAVVATLGVSQPQIALELIRTYLDGMLERATIKAAELKATPRPHFDSVDAEVAWEIKSQPQRPIESLLLDAQNWDSLPALAENTPFAFLDALWPWYVLVLGALRTCSGEDEPAIGFPLLYAVDYRFDGESSFDLTPPALLAALVTAVEQAVKTDSKRFMSWATAEMAVELAPVQRLIAHGLAFDAAGLAQVALDFILSDARRLHLGSYENLQSSTKVLVTACAPFWSAEDVQRFESVVLAYKPAAPPRLSEPAQRRSWMRMIRRAQVELLRALPARNRSVSTQLRVEEESRVFPEARRRRSGGAIIDSIMDAAAMSDASDKDVMNAFRTLPDSTDWDHPKHWDKGGNIQLARAFADFAKTDPSRAVRLISQFAPEAGERAAGYALDSLSEAAEPLLVTGLFLDLSKRGFIGQEFRGSAARAIERLIDRKVSIGNDVIAALEGWLPVESIDAGGVEPDAEAETASASDREPQEKSESDDALGESLLWGAGEITFLPGGDYPVLEALIRARLARDESDQIIEMLTSYLGRCQGTRIWENLLRFLVYLRPGGVDRRAPFIQMVLSKLPQLAGSKASAYLLSQVQWYSPEVVAADLTRWRTLSGRSGRQGFGELTALIAVLQPQLDWPREWLDEIVSEKSLVDARTGAAVSAVNLWGDTKHRAAATDLLIRLLAAGEKGVWAAVFDLFRLVDELTPEGHTIDLLKAIAEQIDTAPLLSGTFVVERIGTLLPHEAELVGQIAGGLVKMWQSQLADMSTATAIAAPHLVDLATTLHRLGPATRELGLNLFEQLVEIDAYQARQMIDEIDNRFRDSATVVRPRLRRRARNSSRRRERDLTND